MYREARRGDEANLRILVGHANFLDQVLDQVRAQAHPIVTINATREKALQWAKEQERSETIVLGARQTEKERQPSRLYLVELAYNDVLEGVPRSGSAGERVPFPSIVAATESLVDA